MLRRFAQDQSGSLGAVLALGTLALVGAISAGLDYTRMTATRAALSAAADAASLAAAQAPAAQAATVARQVFDANFRDTSSVTSFTAEPFTKGDNNAYRVEAAASVRMTLAQAVGFSAARVRALSEVVVGNDSDIQVALVLDVTGSMKGQKLTDLKSSATNMINTLFEKLKRSNQVKIAVVPFSEYVNIGKGNRDANWTTDTQDYTRTRTECAWVKRRGDYIWNCEDYTDSYIWSGCVGSRNYPLNTRDQDYATNPVPGVFNVTCPAAMLALSTSKSTVTSAIDNLAATGNTYIPAGLMWGWAALSSAVPFNEPTDPKRTTRRYLVLMTDGENTISPTYPYHDGGSTTTANTLTSELCTNVKGADIEVFTIAFQVTTNTVKNLLKNCATTTSNYFDATNSSLLANAFTNIARQMSDLRISK